MSPPVPHTLFSTPTQCPVLHQYAHTGDSQVALRPPHRGPTAPGLPPPSSPRPLSPPPSGWIPGSNTVMAPSQETSPVPSLPCSVPAWRVPPHCPCPHRDSAPWRPGRSPEPRSLDSLCVDDHRPQTGSRHLGRVPPPFPRTCPFSDSSRKTPLSLNLCHVTSPKTLSYFTEKISKTLLFLPAIRITHTCHPPSLLSWKSVPARVPAAHVSSGLRPLCPPQERPSCSDSSLSGTSHCLSNQVIPMACVRCRLYYTPLLLRMVNPGAPAGHIVIGK